MRIYDIIAKKRDGCRLARDEIEHFVKGSVSGEVADYQITALLMAMYINGMSPEETFYLTDAMMKSGDTADLSCIHGIKTDKHSTGGVGDKVTLVLAPLVAACGLKMVKLSGRGLGFTGGTVDKLKSVPGMRMDLDEKEVYEIAERVGAVVVNKAGNFAPADKIMYALRDVTATVDSIPLIVASIMSKKLAGGASHILLDVKTGSGALMKTRKRSEELAGMMVRIGELAGRHVTAFVTDMDVPLGHAVGNSLEVAEAVDTLRNRGPADLRELCVKFAGALLESAEAVKPGAGEEFAGEKLSDGSAFDKFKEMIAAQGGNTDFLYDTSLLPQAGKIRDIYAEKAGYVYRIDAEKIGRACMAAGGGRVRAEDEIDYSAGIILHKKTGDKVEIGEKLLSIHTNKADMTEIYEAIDKSYEIDERKPRGKPLIYKKIDGKDLRIQIN